MATTATNSIGQQQQRNYNKTEELLNETTTKTTKSSLTTLPARSSTCGSSVVYDVEHLATFSTNGNTESSTTTNINNRSTSVANDGDANDDCNATGCGKNKIDGDSSCHLLQKQHNTTRTTPKVALQRLFELEKLSGIWTQHMQIELLDEYMLIVDCETNSVVERFNRDCVTNPEAFNQYNDIYNNIVVFIIQQKHQEKSPSTKSKNSSNDRGESDRLEFESSLPSDEDKYEEGELHIFQCVSHEAQQLVSDILAWKCHKSSISSSDQNMANLRSNNEVTKPKQQQQQENNKKSSTAKDQDSQPVSSGRDFSDLPQAASGKKNSDLSSNNKPVVTVASSAKSTGENVPIVNVNVKETVQVFNQIAALREKG